MSKFSERLSGLGQAAPARMGFGRSDARVKNPVMLVIGKGGEAKEDAGSVDLFLSSAGARPGDSSWGLIVDESDTPDLEKLAKDGCQFLLITSDNASAELLLSEDLSVGITVTDDLPDSRIRAIEDGPFEFLLFEPESVSWPLTLGSVLALQDLISSFSKHIFLQLPPGAAMPGQKDLEVMKNLPISAIVVDLNEVKPAEAGKIKEAIGKLEPRKHSHRGGRSALIPSTGLAAAEDTETGDAGFDDDEDDDWDDQGQVQP